MATMIDHKNEFARLEALCSDAAPDSIERQAYYATMSAIENAGDTECEFESAEYWRVAYQSISMTAPFDESKEVQAWFAANDYHW